MDRWALFISAVRTRWLLLGLSLALALAACSRPGAAPTRGEPGVTPASSPPKKAGEAPKQTCGALSYGLHHRPGDTLEAIAGRRAGDVPCAVPCDPAPTFALGPLGRNEHGGYGFLSLKTAACQAPGMPLPIGSCSATCNGADRLGRVSVELADKTEPERERLCRAFEQRRGPPDVGSCDCLKDDLVWLPSATEAGVVLHFMGTWTYECGFDPDTYLPTHFPGH